MEVGVGLKHPLCLVSEGISDIDVLSQCARKHALQIDAAADEAATHPFLFLLGCQKLLFAQMCWQGYS